MGRLVIDFSFSIRAGLILGGPKLTLQKKE